MSNDAEHEQEQEYEQESADALHVLDNVIAELRALDLRRAFHQAGEIVSHPFAGDGTV
jgi:hypothetical protein